VSNLFTVLAGQSNDTFTIGGVKFMAAPVALDEYAEFLSLQGEKGMALGVQAEWMADKLRRRVQGKDPDPATITQEWVLANVPLPTLSVLQHVLLYGEMPKANDEKKAP
jgi:hypothetical protein